MNDITLDMIEEMQHCIGFDKNRVTGTKHRVMHAYRNHFCDHKDNIKWNKLKELGLAERNITEQETGITYFHLTSKGFEFLANLCGFKEIKEID